ncbi:uncharacterized protein K489DRAFT_121458 [Dissoconium aciculare CBS 342.82]|uniref:Uncharacterized protein n=1 Tax=Dissoconium aciculare CBS 342.82 TaxID=1314786 RepID=A0A6J3MF50_9PEZI|nr:uncharacterized protein K489DRAFT_121458 [Dissoconium aciculare CBS 342.82]KAF1826636.1 hypothetical protein K489DRAFT_121458 [Dissoconium aciculare CBS 342.82]
MRTQSPKKTSPIPRGANSHHRPLYPHPCVWNIRIEKERGGWIARVRTASPRANPESPQIDSKITKNRKKIPSSFPESLNRILNHLLHVPFLPEEYPGDPVNAIIIIIIIVIDAPCILLLSPPPNGRKNPVVYCPFFIIQIFKSKSLPRAERLLYRIIILRPRLSREGQQKGGIKKEKKKSLVAKGR